MCGIAGFWISTALERPALQLLREMGDTIAHRGPDGSGEFWDPEAGVGLAHRRLAIIDLSAAGHQPMVSPSGRFVCVFNGEIYNFRALRAELLLLGCEFKGHSDTEVMLAAFDVWGFEASLPRLAGMFAMAVWDRQQERLILARDRFGKKPLYVHARDGLVGFASELRALRHLPAFSPVIDRGALTQFLRHSYVPAPRSIYTGVEKLLPAHFMVYRKTSHGPVLERTAEYWSARAARDAGRIAPLSATDTEGLDQLEDVLRDAVRERMIADVPLGAFLSGGIDSSLVVALMQSQSPRPVQTFCIGFDDVEFDEAVHAAAIARHLGTDHTETLLTARDALESIPLLGRIFDEPFADSSQIATLLVSKMARRHVTVVLSGDGGDEVFGGYHRYAMGRMAWTRLRRMPLPFRRALGSLIESVSPASWDILLRPFRRLLPAALRVDTPGERLTKLAGVMGVDSEDAFYRRLVSHWTAPASIVIGGAEPPQRSVIAPQPDGTHFAEEMMLVDALTYLPDDILVKVDRASMACSLEARAPLLDHRVFEFAACLPFRFKLRDGRSKWALRQILARHIPESLFERPKTGFAVPIGAWLRGPLREWAEQLLDAGRLNREGYFNPGPIRRLWAEHLAGRSHQYDLWDILMFQSWLEGQA